MSKPGRGAPGVPRKRTGEIKTSISVVYEAFKHMRCSEMIVRDISAKSGVTVESMRRWRLGVVSPNIADFEAVLNVLGYELKLSPLDDTESRSQRGVT